MKAKRKFLVRNDLMKRYPERKQHLKYHEKFALKILRIISN